MLRMVLRKMLSNPWMMLCLLVGSILAVAMVSSIPMYTDGVLQRMLIKDLENYQLETGNYPGRYLVRGGFYAQYAEEDRTRAYRVFDRKITTDFVEEIGLPVLRSVKNMTIDHLVALPEEQREEDPKKRFMKLDTVTDLEKHISMVHGRLFSDSSDLGYYEVIISEEAMKKYDLRLNEIYTVDDLLNLLEEPMRFKVVGIFTIEETNDPYWFQGLWAYRDSMLMDYGLFQKLFIDTDSPLLSNVQWFYAFDYHAMNLDSIKTVLSAYESQNRYFNEYRSLDWRFPAVPILQQYSEREARLKLTLWVLQVPILLMLAFYLFMVSQLIVEHEKNEIAVMKSRGSSSLQVFVMYLLQSLILSGVALLAGPPLGLFLCTILGASNGFLEFVQRTALPLSLSSKAYAYSLLAVALFMLTMLIPAYMASRTSIVVYKQKKARGVKTSIWKKYFLDVLLLGIAAYGLYSYQNRQSILGITGAEATDLAADPLLFLISTLFILGIGLVFLRLYPYLVSLVFWLGRKIWPPVMYASFIQVGRSGARNQFLMLFIIVTLSIGLFNANAARTINSNLEEKVSYQMGADIIINAYWPSNEVKSIPMGNMGMPSFDIPISKEPLQYQEPPFQPFRELPGVESATKVFRKSKVVVTAMGQRINNAYLMGIITDEFGKLAWFRRDLLSHHIGDYLNLIAANPHAVLVSSSFREKYNLREGDSIFMTWNDQGYIEGTIYAFIDYWPTYNPIISEDGVESPDFIVANYGYIRAKMALEPYEIWIDKSEGASSSEIYKAIEDRKLQITRLEDASQQIISMKNDPMIQGTNGALTLGFVVTMTISMIGFLIYWILSIYQRVLNFGIFRAMGLSQRSVIGMLVWEQLLISGVAVILGIVVGGVTSDMFVPMLQLAHNAAQQIPPFRVVAHADDYTKVYGVVAFMLTFCLVVLGAIISRIKIAQAIKLGED